MTDARDPKLKLFELCLGTAEKVSDRCAQANTLALAAGPPPEPAITPAGLTDPVARRSPTGVWTRRRKPSQSPKTSRVAHSGAGARRPTRAGPCGTAGWVLGW